MRAMICLIAACAALSASTTCASLTSFAPASTITRPSLVPATTRSSLLSLRCANVGLMTYCAVEQADADAGDRLLERNL